MGKIGRIPGQINKDEVKTFRDNNKSGNIRALPDFTKMLRQESKLSKGLSSDRYKNTPYLYDSVYKIIDCLNKENYKDAQELIIKLELNLIMQSSKGTMWDKYKSNILRLNSVRK